MPVVGCGCRTCTSDDPRDQRTRHAALLTLEGGRLLVDTPPELRMQLVKTGTVGVEAVWFTHIHADHVHGIDDLRIITTRRQADLTAYANEECAEELRSRFPYIFDPRVPAPEGTTTPQIRLRKIPEHGSLEILGEEFTPLSLPHGNIEVSGFRVGDLGYVTDAKSLPPAVLEALRGVRVLVLNALWWGDAHPIHFNVEEAVEAARSVGAERTYLVHLTHRLLHTELEAGLPEGLAPAYDGLSIDI